MQAAIEQYRENIKRVRNLGSIYQALSAQTTGVLDLADILRSELVMALSALDHFIHELVRSGMLEAYHGHRGRTDACLRFQVTLGSAIQGFTMPTSGSWLEEQIRLRHGYLSFQQPDRIADAIRLVSDIQLWNEVADRLGTTSQNVRVQLGLIVSRRNQIAHEADMDPSYAGRLWPIDFGMVDEAVTFMEQLAETIYSIVE